MAQIQIPKRDWLTMLGAIIAGIAAGGLLLGPPSASAMSLICGCGAYEPCGDLADPF